MRRYSTHKHRTRTTNYVVLFLFCMHAHYCLPYTTHWYNIYVIITRDNPLMAIYLFIEIFYQFYILFTRSWEFIENIWILQLVFYSKFIDFVDNQVDHFCVLLAIVQAKRSLDDTMEGQNSDEKLNHPWSKTIYLTTNVIPITKIAQKENIWLCLK